MTFKNKKKDCLINLTKSADLIKIIVDKTLYLFINNKNIAKIYNFFENKFLYISSISITKIFYKIYTIKYLNCKKMLIISTIIKQNLIISKA